MKIDIPSIFSIIGGISLFVGGGFYIFSVVRKNDLDVLRKANTDLRDSINDKSRKIDDLAIKIGVLEQKVTTLESENGDLKILVKEALVMYFTRNPQVANNLQNVPNPQI